MRFTWWRPEAAPLSRRIDISERIPIKLDSRFSAVDRRWNAKRVYFSARLIGRKAAQGLLMMTAQNLYTSAFLLGLLGGVHCVGMCGGIVAALTFGLPEQVRKRPWAMAPYLVAYNLGRISSYALAGALAGSIGYLAANLVTVHYAQQALRIIAGLFMVILGLYLADWWKGLARLEAIGGLAWRRIEPLGRKLLPVTTPTQAILVGLIWGWLPCGMVYSALVWSMTGGSAVEGALLMLAFGAGTLPTLLSLGAVSATLASIVRKIWLRRVAGALVIGLGGHTVAKVLWESPTHGG